MSILLGYKNTIRMWLYYRLNVGVIGLTRFILNKSKLKVRYIYYEQITRPRDKVKNSGVYITILFINNKLLLHTNVTMNLLRMPYRVGFFVLWGCICGVICGCQGSVYHLIWLYMLNRYTIK